MGSNGTEALTAPAQLSDEDVLTWEELSTPKTRRLYVPKYGKYVEFLSMVPFDVNAQLQAQFLGAERHWAAYGLAILEYVMVKPSLRTPEAKRAALKADGALLMQIINEVVNEKDAKEIKNALPNV